MSAPPQEPTGTLALEMERIRGSLNTGFARIEGSLSLLVQRSDQTDRALGEQRDQVLLLEKRCDAIELNTAGVPKFDTRIRALERWMWVAIGVSTTLGTVGGIVAGVVLH